ncbi:MAG: PD-(D/E)XK nuclease domain-containing protein [Calditerrivibrio sp.]|uniref:PD-(D/E)XK nuclease domain-containing protein n=1 Tax=Calditerrivibrio sp. TaxID=2792612 RepID=UPI003D152070
MKGRAEIGLIRALQTNDIGKIRDILYSFLHQFHMTGIERMIEFKVVVDESENKALNQIKEKRYFEKYQSKYDEIYLIGMEFSRKYRNIIYFG